MAIVILGGGIIGVATAFYLSELVSDPSSLHIIEASPTLFAGASGYAGGFLAKDWFSSSVSSLGGLSFKLHKELSDEHDGITKWGYLPSTALSLGISGDVGVGKGERGEDWLLQGTSRAAVADKNDFLNPDGSPAWLTKQKGGTLDVISGPDDCAQVDPGQLCQFLLSESLKRGVQLHQPATATSINTNSDTKTIESITITYSTTSHSPPISPKTLPLDSLILAAGPWTPGVFSTLFPSSNYKPPISALAGHSLLLRTPRQSSPPFTSPTPHPANVNTNGTPTIAAPPATSHAIFCAPSPSSNISFAPELFSRASGSIYIAGLNSPTKPLPDLANEKPIEEPLVQELKSVAARLINASNTNSNTEAELQIERTGLCWRPVTSTGAPIIGKIPETNLARGKADGNEIKARKDGGVYIAAGHGPWGISLSLGTGLVVAEMVVGKEVTSARVERLRP